MKQIVTKAIHVVFIVIISLNYHGSYSASCRGDFTSPESINEKKAIKKSRGDFISPESIDMLKAIKKCRGDFTSPESIDMLDNTLAPLTVQKTMKKYSSGLFPTFILGIGVLGLVIFLTGCNGDFQKSKIPEKLKDEEKNEQFFEPKYKSQIAVYDKPPSFPGAVGPSAYDSFKVNSNTEVIVVDQLEDYLKNENPIIGSLRWALNQGGNKIIVFNVGGTIHLKGPLMIKHSNIRIAGQTAPGDQGIYIKGARIVVTGSNNLFEFFHGMHGTDLVLSGVVRAKNADSISIRGSNNLIRNSSLRFSLDEILSLYKSKDVTPSALIHRCLLADPLYNTSSLRRDKEKHSRILIADHGTELFIFQSLMINGNRRSLFVKSNITAINNLIYGWGSMNRKGMAIHGHAEKGPIKADILYNLLIPRPAFNHLNGSHQFPIQFEKTKYSPISKIYFEGLLTFPSEKVKLIELINQNPVEIYRQYKDLGIVLKTNLHENLMKYYNMITDRELLYNTVLNYSGADSNKPMILHIDDKEYIFVLNDSSWIQIKSAKDMKLLPDHVSKREIINRSGQIKLDMKSVHDVYGESLTNDKVISEIENQDGDFIPSDWEMIVGSNPKINDAFDQIQIGQWDDNSGYTNIELYLSWIAGDYHRYLSDVINFLKDSSQTKVIEIREKLKNILSRSNSKEIIPTVIYLMKNGEYLNELRHSSNDTTQIIILLNQPQIPDHVQLNKIHSLLKSGINEKQLNKIIQLSF